MTSSLHHVAHIAIEVVYALKDKQVLMKHRVPVGTTAEQAVLLSNIAAQFEASTFPAAPWHLGIFSKTVPNDTVLREGDRLEIYRPLIADPKEVRRQRAQAGKAMSKGGGDAVDESNL